LLPYPEINPVAVDLGILQVRWYGLSYGAGIVSAILLGQLRARSSHCPIAKPQVVDLILYIAIGAIIGGRLGYTMFYNFLFYITHPIDIFKIWEGGMSFHGGLIGSVIGLWVFSSKANIGFWRTADFSAPLCALGLFFGRIANFINQELWGRAGDVPWAMVFPLDPQQLPRHPSQLYEAALEGIVLFVIVWLFSAKPRPSGAVSGLFLTGYGIFRFFVEFFREPDESIGFIFTSWFTMGQLLSLPLIIFGIYLLSKIGRQRRIAQ